MARPLITLTTDFGEGSPYIAQMKAVILALNPAAHLVDVTHSIAPQSVRHGAIVLRDVTAGFPPDCVHIAVIDPGVGTDRPIVFARIGAQNFIAPDNGLLNLAAEREGCVKVVRLTERRYWNPVVSATFHGRDIMAPAAAHLSLGLPPEHLGPAARLEAPLDWPAVQVSTRSMMGQIVAVDHFGNLITNISEALLEQHVDRSACEAGMEISVRGHRIQGLVTTYGTRPTGDLVALLGSSGWLEVAQVRGSAARMLEAQIDDRVELNWDESR